MLTACLLSIASQSIQTLSFSTSPTKSFCYPVFLTCLHSYIDKSRSLSSCAFLSFDFEPYLSNFVVDIWFWDFI